MPQNFNNYQLNEIQAYLYRIYTNMLKDVGEVDACFVAGDLVDGINKAEKSRGLVTANIYEQSKMAYELLSKVKTTNFYVVEGSGYHTGSEVSGDLLVSDMLHATFGDPDQVINVENVKIHLRHVADWSKDPAGRHTSTRKEANVSVLEGDDFDLFIRGHTHHFNFNGDVRNETLILPCWKAPDKFQRKKSLENTDIGYVLLTIDGNNFEYEPHTYKVPTTIWRTESTLL
jgi:hypothetical protein